MGKRSKKERNRRLSLSRARNRVIDNCWRALTDDKSKQPKVLEKAAFVLRYFKCLPPACSAEELLGRAEKVARENGFKASYPTPTKKKRAPAHTPKSGTRKKQSDAFYASWEWKQVRYEALMMHGRQCMCCGWSPSPGSKGRLCVDHIKPRSKYPKLALDVTNTQILCDQCNRGKSNIYEHDFRSEWHGEDEEPEVDPLTAQFNGIMQ